MLLQNIVGEMRAHQNNNIPLDLPMLDTCILCKKYKSSQQWSLFLERKIKNMFNLQCTNKLKGDAVGVNNKCVEIKVSLGSKNAFNFVQIRPDHDIQYFLFLLYDVMEGDLGKCHWICIPKNDIYELIEQYGSYAHGSKKVHGPITNVSIRHNNYEYALRPSIHSQGKSNRLWIEMLKYRVDEDTIFDLFNKID